MMPPADVQYLLNSFYRIFSNNVALSAIIETKLVSSENSAFNWFTAIVIQVTWNSINCKYLLVSVSNLQILMNINISDIRFFFTWEAFIIIIIRFINQSTILLIGATKSTYSESIAVHRRSTPVAGLFHKYITSKSNFYLYNKKC